MDVHKEQDFSFPMVVESSATADLFVSSSPSLWRISSLDSVNFFQDGDHNSSPTPSPQVHGLEHGKERSASTCEREGDEDAYGSGGGHHDRTETMDPLWEEFNFSEELLLHRVPSHLSSGARGLDQLYPEPCATKYNYSTNTDQEVDEKGEEAGYGIPLQLQPLDMSKKKMSTSSTGRSSCSISNSSKRQRRRVVMLKMVRRFLWLHILARHKR